MVNLGTSPVEVRLIGRHMSRARYQRGSLKKIGKSRKMWRGRWHVYLKQPNGSEKLCKREKILGPATELTKSRAQELLDGLIKLSTSQIVSGLSPNTTAQELWARYSDLKIASWSNATRKALASVFTGSSGRKSIQASSR